MELENLQISENGYFFESKKKSKLSKHRILEYFNQFENYFNDYKKRFSIESENIKHNGKEFCVSILVFHFSEQPSFLKDTAEKELKYGYIILIEHNSFIIVNKRNSINPNIILENFANEIGYSDILNCFLKNESQIQKIGIRTIDVSDHIIRKKVFEAKNLKNSLSIFHINKYILGSMKINNGDEILSINASTSNIGKYSKKLTLLKFLDFCADTVHRIKSNNSVDSYLKNFPHTEETLSLNLLTPIGILIYVYEIFENQDIEYIYYKNKRKREIEIRQNRIISALSDSFVVTNNVIENKYDTSFKLELSRSNKKFIIKSKMLNDISIKYRDQTSVNLLKLINRTNLYMVNFKQPEYSYSHKKLFKDSKLLGNIDSFLEIFSGIKELEKVKSENGQKGNKKVAKTDISFPTNSIFHVTEKVIAKDAEYLICDDAGYNEWADYIALYENRIQFLHAKHDDSELSGQSLHVVISQAQKNIANLANFIEWETRKMINQKTKFDKIGSDWEETKIKRLRIGNTVKDATNYYNKLNHKINVQKEVAIVINFLSIKLLKEELEKLKENNSNKPQVSQILWMISSLVLSCKEAGLNIKIYTSP